MRVKSTTRITRKVPPILFVPRPAGRIFIEATDPMTTQTHSLREHPAIVRNIIAFLVITIALYWLLGAVGILYALALGALFLLFYLLTRAFAALLDPDVY
jgi:hypothetical protein